MLSFRIDLDSHIFFSLQSVIKEKFLRIFGKNEVLKSIILATAHWAYFSSCAECVD